MKTWVKAVIGVVAVAILAVTAGPFIYIHFIKDDQPAPLSLDDAPGGTSVTDAVDKAPTTDSTATSDPVDSTASSTGSSGGSVAPSTGVDGNYSLTSDSQAGYRVTEVLFGQDTEAVGRTSDITGTLTLAGTQVTAASFEVDMTTVVSSESRRDAQFTGRIMETDQFPTATFELTQPIELGSIPADGTEISVKATGDLTLHGVTKSVVLDLTAKIDGGVISAAGTTGIVFADYDIDNPSTRGITTQDHGTLEFLLVFAKS